MKNRRLILIGIPIVAALIAAALIFSQGSSSTPPSPTNLVDVTEVVAELQGIPETKGVLGYPDAPITIVEYGDLRCPVCKEFDLQTMPDVIEQLVKNHKVKVDFKHWSILGPNSDTAGEAAWAAMQQDKFWAFSLVTYANQGDETTAWFTTSFAHAAASAVGIDVAAFDSARNSSTASDYLQTIKDDATKRGFTGTPTLVVKGPKGEKVLNGVPDLKTVTDAVTAAGGA